MAVMGNGSHGTSAISKVFAPSDEFSQILLIIGNIVGGR